MTDLEPIKVVRDTKELRAPICCVLGHVDAGKTSLLDKLRTTNVMEGEAGGITQQIGATFFPLKHLKEAIEPVSKKYTVKTDIPGLLILDTPGHASFTNLRSRGTSICDLAIVVIDYHDGLQPQTIESLKLLREQRTPFVVVINKLDRIYGWESHPELEFTDCLKQQTKDIQRLVLSRISEINAELAGLEYNSVLYSKNKDFKKWVSVIPVSARSGDGVCTLLAMVMQLTQRLMPKRLTVSSEFKAVVMEVKKTPGYGTTLDVILVNGQLNVSDTIVVCGMNGPITSKVRSIIVPFSLQELRVTGWYHTVEHITAAQCVKISAANLDSAIAGTTLHVANDSYDLVEFEKQVQDELRSASKYETVTDGVLVKASTLGSLEAMYNYLTENEIPISSTGIGEITHKDLIKAGVIAERNSMYGCILAFDLHFTNPELVKLAEEKKITVITNDVLYQLVTEYEKYHNKCLEKYRETAVWPCELELRKEWLFRHNKPMILGCKVITGKLNKGMMVISKDGKTIGEVTKIILDNKETESVEPGRECTFEIAEAEVVAERHFLIDPVEPGYSLISRETIDALKKIKVKLSQKELKLIVHLKKILNIV